MHRWNVSVLVYVMLLFEIMFSVREKFTAPIRCYDKDRAFCTFIKHMPILQQNLSTRIVYICVPAGSLHTLDVTRYTKVGLHVMLHTFTSQREVRARAMESVSVNCVLLRGMRLKQSSIVDD